MPPPPERPRAFIRRARERLLSQADFDAGPVELLEPDTRCVFTSNVVVDFRHLTPPARSPTHLGFFAAVVVGASRVELDLGGHTLRMSDEYAEAQRFFALVSLDVTPFPVGAARFTTEPLRPTDVTIRNGVFGLTSHFAVHSATGGRRVLLHHLTLASFEVDAIALSGHDDVWLRDLHIGPPRPPLTSARFVALRDLHRSLLALPAGDAAEAAEASRLAAVVARLRDREHAAAPAASDALVRGVVLVPAFNVGRVPESFPAPVRRVRLERLRFSDIAAAPRAVTAMCRVGQPDTEMIKDVNGNVVCAEDLGGDSDARAVAAAQVLVTPGLPGLAELLAAHSADGRGASLRRVASVDSRGHDLRGKASCAIRVDGAVGLTVLDVRIEAVRSEGERAAAACLMVNGCRDVRIEDLVVLGGSHASGAGGTSMINAQRPQGGVYLRGCQAMHLDRLRLQGREHCGMLLQGCSGVRLGGLVLAAPLVCSPSCRDVQLVELTGPSV